MKISQMLQTDRPMLSCEIFPPKTTADFDTVWNAATEIAKSEPAFISVTFGAGGGRSKNTVELAHAVERQLGVSALAHLPCVSSTREQVGQVLDELEAAGIENVLALRGDIPAATEFPLPEQYHYAAELIREVKARGKFCIGAACYPEGHVESSSFEADLDHLKEKVDCGCDFLTTQMFFDNNMLYRFLYRAMKKGVEVPVLAGIMPVTSGKMIRRSCQLSGATLPPRFRAIVDKFGGDPASMKQAGIAYATEQIIDLIANGVNHIHLYTMNKPDVTQAIVSNLSTIFGK